MVNDAMRQEVEREILRYAVSRSIFCPVCEVVMDTDAAVLWYPTEEGTARTFVLCTVCSDRMVESMSSVEHAAMLARYEVTDGRSQ